MSKRVVDVGQCAPDHAAIRRMLEHHFDVQIVQTQGVDDTLAALSHSAADLVLINRKLDRDYSDGIEIFHRIKADATIATVPVMLVSNLAEHQQMAVDAGAAPGFGKAELNADETLARLRPFLG